MLGGREARKPDGRAAELDPFDAGREAVAGLGPNFTFGLYKESNSYKENDSAVVDGRPLCVDILLSLISIKDWASVEGRLSCCQSLGGPTVGEDDVTETSGTVARSVGGAVSDR